MSSRPLENPQTASHPVVQPSFVANQNHVNDSYIPSIKSLRDISLIGMDEGTTGVQDNHNALKSMWHQIVKPNLKLGSSGAYGTVVISKLAFKYIPIPVTNDLDDRVYSTSDSNEQLTMEETLQKFRHMVETEVRFQTIAAQKGVAPKVWTHFYTEEGAVIVMQALDKFFIDYVNEHQRLSQTHVQRIIHILKTLSEAKIDFNDQNLLGNLMTDEKNEIYIIDFGMGKEIPMTEFEMYGPYPLMTYLIILNRNLGGRVNSKTGLREGPFSNEITEYENKYNKEIDFQAHSRRRYLERVAKRVKELRRSERIQHLNKKKETIAKE